MGDTKEKQKETDPQGSRNKYVGFELFPDRRNTAKKNWLTRFFSSGSYKSVCEVNVCNSIKDQPVVRLLINALRNSGCPFDIKRHISCEECDLKVTGGYDAEMNQIVICYNTLKGRSYTTTTLVHELIHMFDYCVNRMNFEDNDHLACTEIRAANMAHCSFVSSFLLAQSSLFNIRDTHKYCVKMKAAQSMMVARNMDLKEAMSHISKVFDRCYNDLEPIGRRVRRNSCEGRFAYDESINYAYTKRRADE